MGRYVFSFLGRQASRGGVAEYRDAEYRFADGHSVRTRAFAGALVDWLPRRERPIDGLVIAGTRSSMWGVLIDLLPDAGHDDLTDLWTDVTSGSVDPGGVDDGLLGAWGAALKEALGVEVHLLVTGRCEDTEQQLDLVHRMARVIPEGTQIVLDITHGFRHLPLLGLVAAHYLRHTRRCSLESVYYGMNEGRDAEGHTPVLDLAGLLRILDVAEAFGAYEMTGHLGPLARAFTDTLPDLEPAAFFLDTLQIGHARRPTRSAIAAARASTSPLLRTAFPELSRLLTDVASGTRLHTRLFSRARAAAGASDPISAVKLLWEAISTLATHRGGGSNTHDFEARRAAVKSLVQRLPAPDGARLETLRRVRNAVSHGTPPTKGDASRALQGRAALSAFVGELLTWTRDALPDLEPPEDR